MPNMSNAGRQDLHHVDETSFEYIYEQNVTVPLPNSSGLIRCNVYRPKAGPPTRFPVLVTYGPYGKDIPYETFVTSVTGFVIGLTA